MLINRIGSVNINHSKEGIKVIKTKYYSDLTKKFYDVETEAEKEEEREREKNALELKKKEERAAQAKEIENAYKEYIDAYKKYAELRNSFIKSYGSYHMTYKDNLPKVLDSNVFDLLDFIF